MPPGFIFIQLLLLGVPIAGAGFFGWLALRYVRARERDAGIRIDAVRPEDVARLEDVVLALQSELQTLRERQDFVERLLDRPRGGPDAD